MKSKSTTSDIVPLIGMGATIQIGSDRIAGTIIQATPKRIVIQEDKKTRIDNNGMSEMQEYKYDRDPNGSFYVATLRKDGRYRVSFSKMLVSLNVRYAYYDFSF